jgi:hypothetical protein
MLAFDKRVKYGSKLNAQTIIKKTKDSDFLRYLRKEQKIHGDVAGVTFSDKLKLLKPKTPQQPGICFN